MECFKADEVQRVLKDMCIIFFKNKLFMRALAGKTLYKFPSGINAWVVDIRHRNVQPFTEWLPSVPNVMHQQSPRCYRGFNFFNMLIIDSSRMFPIVRVSPKHLLSNQLGGKAIWIIAILNII